MVSEKLQRELPWCTMFLVLGAVVFHALTLAGNFKTAASLKSIGSSVTGWSLVGMGLSDSLGTEMNDEVDKVETKLTDVISKIEEGMDDLESLLSLFGDKVDTSANKTVSLLMAQDELVSDPMGAILSGILDAMKDLPKLDDLNGLLTKFLNEITPALEIVGKWIIKFGSTIQNYIGQLGTTVDRSQKIFDKVLDHLSKSTGMDTMMFETFNLYDITKVGYITSAGLQNVGTSYGIDAFQGATGAALFKKYDVDNSSGIEYGPEFLAFVSDKTVPKSMSVLLRMYAKFMSQIGGEISKAYKRTDMSSAVSSYLQLVAARNLTKVSWVSQALTNGTLPIDFTACVLIQLALDKIDPTSINSFSLTTVDIGGMVVGAMLTNNVSAVMDAIDAMSESNFFTTQGFVSSEQPAVLATLTYWVTVGPSLWRDVWTATASMLDVGEEGTHASVPLLQVFDGMPATAKKIAEQRVAEAKKARIAQRLTQRRSRLHTETHQLLLTHLVDGRLASSVPESAAEQVVNGGVTCAPVTLEWAKWLSSNASQTSDELNGYAMSYAKTSSSTKDSFNTQIQGFVKKVTSFITVMESYSTPAGIASLKSKIESFEANAMKDVMNVVESTILNLVKSFLGKAFGTTSSSDASLLHAKTAPNTPERAAQILAKVRESSAAKQAEKEAAGVENGLSAVWSEVNLLLTELYALLPSGVNTVKTAKTDVQEVFSTLKSIFTVLGEKGPVVFQEASEIYKIIWIIYFFIVAPFTIGILFYGFWANGWFGGPQATDWSDYTPPQTCSERMSVCWKACCQCCSACCDSSLCFWSFIILMQVVSLILLVMSILFTIIGGIDIFMAAGCSEIYLITDDKICQTSMSELTDFLSTFSVGAPSGLNPMSDACSNHNLLLCEEIASKLEDSAKYTIMGAFLACLFTFQLIFDTAILHERARWRRIADEMSLQEKQ